ncbi:uncharacterized protein LOC144744645 [Ciona intestinalis]
MGKLYKYLIKTFEIKLSCLSGRLKESDKLLENSNTENLRLKEQLMEKQQTMEIAELVTTENVHVESDCKETEGPTNMKTPDINKLVTDVQDQLESANETIRLKEIQILQLKDNLSLKEETISSIPSLQQQIFSMQSQVEGASVEILSLREQIMHQQQNMSDMEKQMQRLADELECEKSSNNKHEKEIDCLRLEMEQKSQVIESMRQNEVEITDKLAEGLERLAEKQDRINELENEIIECMRMKEAITVDFNDLTSSLEKAECEKSAINDELQRLEDVRKQTEANLDQEIVKCKTLHENSMKEQQKWEEVLFMKGEELTEVTSRCNHLIQEREEAARKFEQASSTKKHFIAAVVLLIAVFVYILLGCGNAVSTTPS